MRRLWEIDALRGLMLVLMTITHLPTRLSSPLGQPFGHVSAAEGFVLLSGFMAGLVYTAKGQRQGEAELRSAFWLRAFKIYLCQAALLIFLFTAVAVIGVVTGQDAITNMIGFYFERPVTALVGSLLLVYSPPLLDILPMYIVFMLISPVLVMHGLRHGWTGVMAASLGLWFAAQFGLAALLYEWAEVGVGFPVPARVASAFNILGWQLLWVIGLWIGATMATEPNAPPVVFPRWMVTIAIAVALVGFAWRHGVGQVPFPDAGSMSAGNLLFDKWRLGPLRLLNLLALVTLVWHFSPWLLKHLPRVPVLEMMGAASLPVFCAHLVLALLALGFFGAAFGDRPWAVDIGIVVVSFGLLVVVAWISQKLDERAAEVRARWKARRSAHRLRPS